MAGKKLTAQTVEAKVITDNGPKDMFALVSSALHSHCATLYSSARFVCIMTFDMICGSTCIFDGTDMKLR
jgi:hypothetical protein